MSEGVKIDGGIVGQRVGLEVRPEVFDRVEFGGVRRQVLEMRRAGKNALVDEVALVGLEAVPDLHDGCAQLPLQMLEEVLNETANDPQLHTFTLLGLSTAAL